MTTTTWIDIIDTAVKIGLGAVISGITAYSLSRVGYLHDRKKYVFENRQSVLREIVDCKQKCGLLLNAVSHSSHSLTLPADAEIAKRDTEKIMDAYVTMGQAQGLSYMIGLEQLNTIVDKYCDAIIQYYYAMSKIGETLDVDGAKEKVNRINELSEEFRKEIPKAYEIISK